LTFANFITCISSLLFLTTLIPLIHHDFWVFRVFEYPRLQKLFINVLLLPGFIYVTDLSQWVNLIVLAGLVINLCYLISLILPFTVFAKKQLLKSRLLPNENNINLLIANVFQENRRAADYHRLITSCNPDVVLMVETNRWWQREMDSIKSNYPYFLAAPLENTYGMLLYSRLKLFDGSINYLVEKDIPSIEVSVQIPSGQLVKLYCLHPQPPVPQENPRSTARDKEILIVAEKAKSSDLPVLVIGDLNDVAWSYTTDLFSKISGLLDPRKGRGFFNSFNAKYFFMRFPLDHVFCSNDFSLTAIKRMNSCGSDHFPMCVNLQYDPQIARQQPEPMATGDEKETAEEKINATI
jgi:endonuclease/exonuclease/phosphatase (EEP) superfamily protein YafD